MEIWSIFINLVRNRNFCKTFSVLFLGEKTCKNILRNTSSLNFFAAFHASNTKLLITLFLLSNRQQTGVYCFVDKTLVGDLHADM